MKIKTVKYKDDVLNVHVYLHVTSDASDIKITKKPNKIKIKQKG